MIKKRYNDEILTLLHPLLIELIIDRFKHGFSVGYNNFKNYIMIDTSVTDFVAMIS